MYEIIVTLDLISYIIIAVASVIPPALCFAAASRVPRFLLPLVYLLGSIAMIWFLHSFGDDLLPRGTVIYFRHSTIDASGDFLAAWTGLMLTLYGIAAVWFMIADARERRRKALLPQTGANPGSRHGRRDGGKSRAAGARRSCRERGDGPARIGWWWMSGGRACPI
ncbi:MAG: hypothetical protein WDN69_03815 [Aliidongia sp.]